MTETIESFQVEGLTVEVKLDEDGSYADPRQWDHLGTMLCWHPDYALGDVQFRDQSGQGAIANHPGGALRNREREHPRSGEFTSMEQVERYLRLAERAVCVLPLYLLDHSGLSMSAGSPSPFDNPRVERDHLGHGLGWDTTLVGFIYTTRERIEELCGEDFTPNCPQCGRPKSQHEQGVCTGPIEGWGEWRSRWIEKQLDAEVAQYNAWLAGDVTYYVVKNDEGEVLDSCGGFVGEADYCAKEGREAAESIARDLRAEDEPDVEQAIYAAVRS